MKFSMKRMFGGCIAALAALCTGVASAAAITTMTDLNGGSQNVEGNWSTIFGNGGGIYNGTLNATINDWWQMAGVTFTVGNGGKLVTTKKTTSAGQGNFRTGGTLIIDGGEVVYNNNRGSSYGFYLGNDVASAGDYDGKMEIKNGGKFTSTYQFFRVGYNTYRGMLVINNGTMILPYTSNCGLRLPGTGTANTSGATAEVDFNQATLKGYRILFNEGSVANTIHATFKDSNFELVYVTKGSGTPNEGSYANFDGVTIKTHQNLATSGFLEDIGIPYTLVGNGLTLDVGHDNVRAEGSYAGTGPFIKKGAKPFTFKGTYNSTGAMEVQAGEFTIDPAATITDGTTFKAADGTTVVFPFADGAFVTEKSTTLQLDANTSGSVALSVTGASGMTPDTFYPVCALSDENMLSRITVASNMETKYEDGSLCVKIVPTTHTWDGGATDTKWSSALNWNTDQTPTLADNLIFNLQAGGTTTNDLSVALGYVNIAAGDWTHDLNSAALNASSVTIASGASMTLTRPKSTNPLPTAYKAVTVSGLLDLGGANQTVSSFLFNGSNTGNMFRNNSELRHGKVTVDVPASADGNSQWCRLTDTTLTIGPGGHLYIPEMTTSCGQINFSGTHLIIDGGTFECLNKRNLTDSGAYIGNGGDAVVEIKNGGTFKHPNHEVRLGSSNDAAGKKGSLICTEGTVDLGEKTFRMGYSGSGVSVLAMTNSTLKCGKLYFGYSDSKTVGRQTAIFKDTELQITDFGAAKVHADSSITFDGATVADKGSNANVFYGLMNGSLPYTVAAGGLTIKVSDNTKQAGMKITGEFVGPGNITFEPQGDSPREVNHYGPRNNLTGKIVVQNGITYNLPADVQDGRRAYGGGFEVQSNATVSVLKDGVSFGGDLDVQAGATFTITNAPNAAAYVAGNATLNGDVTFAGLDLEVEHGSPVKLLTATGTITKPGLDTAIEGTRNRFFVRAMNSGNVLYYGVKLGTTFIVR